MGDFITRRNLIGGAGGLVGSVGVASKTRAGNAGRLDRVEADTHTEDYYDKLGVRKIINAAGTYTILTASVMPPSVQAAVATAAKHPVRLLELQKKAGEYLAQRLKCEAAMVTAGA